MAGGIEDKFMQILTVMAEMKEDQRKWLKEMKASQDEMIRDQRRWLKEMECSLVKGFSDTDKKEIDLENSDSVRVSPEIPKENTPSLTVMGTVDCSSLIPISHGSKSTPDLFESADMTSSPAENEEKLRARFEGSDHISILDMPSSPEEHPENVRPQYEDVQQIYCSDTPSSPGLNFLLARFEDGHSLWLSDISSSPEEYSNFQHARFGDVRRLRERITETTKSDSDFRLKESEFNLCWNPPKAESSHSSKHRDSWSVFSADLRTLIEVVIGHSPILGQSTLNYLRSEAFYGEYG